MKEKPDRIDVDLSQLSSSNNPSETSYEPLRLYTLPVNTIFRTFIVVLMVIGALGITVWKWWESEQNFRKLEEKVAKQIAEMNRSADDNRLNLQQAIKSLQDGQGQFKVIDERLNESKNSQESLAALYEKLARHQSDLELSEIEQIVAIGNQQLQLARNVRGAITALETTDRRLTHYGSPEFVIVRQIINRDLDKLRTSPDVDIVGLTFKINGLIEQVDKLPLRLEEEAQLAKLKKHEEAKHREFDLVSVAQEISQEVFSEIKSLVQIHHLKNPPAPLLDPTQSYFLRENLKLRLLSARLALIQRNEVVFQADVKACIDWLNKYYDLRVSNAQKMNATLGSIAKLKLNPELPDLSASLNAIRSIKLGREPEPKPAENKDKATEQKPVEQPKADEAKKDEKPADKPAEVKKPAETPAEPKPQPEANAKKPNEVRKS